MSKKYTTDNITILGTLDDGIGVGTAGQVLSSTSLGVSWINGSGIAGGPYLPLSAGSSFPLTGNLFMTGDSYITTNTIDGADTGSLNLSGGGAFGDSRGASIGLAGNEDGNGGLIQIRAGQGTASQVRLYTSGNEIARFDDGNLSLYTATSKILGGTAAGRLVLANSASSTYITLGGSGWSDPNSMLFVTASSVSMFIDDTGKVGIGTTSPSSKLEIGPNGSLGVVANKKVLLNLDGGYATTGVGATGQYKVLGFVGTTKDVTDITAQTSGEVEKNFYLGTIGGDYFNGNRFSIWQGGLERLTVQGYGTNVGYVGIGTSNPSEKLNVSGDTSLDGLVFANQSNSYNNSTPGITSFGNKTMDASVTYYDIGKNVDTNARGIVWTGKHYIVTEYSNLKAVFYDNNFDPIPNANGDNFVTLPAAGGYGAPHGAAWDGRYLYCAQYNGNNVIIVGYDIDNGTSTATIVMQSANFTTGGSAYGLEYAEGHLYTAISGAVQIYKLEGKNITHVFTSANILDSITSQGVTYDGSYIWMTQNGQAVYKVNLDGTLEEKITTGWPPHNVCWAWNGENIVSANYTTGDVYLLNTSLKRIDSEITALMGGSVGINTLSPVDKLTIYDADDNVGIQIQTATSGTSSGDGFRLGLNNSHAFLWNYENTPLAFGTNGSQKVTILADGKVGIGVTLPPDKLSVIGTITATDSLGAYNNGYFAKLYSNYGPLALRLASRTGDVFQATDYGASVTLLTGGTATASLFVSSGKTVQFNGYSGTLQTGTPTYMLGTDSVGNIVKTNTIPGSAAGPYLPLAGGTMTGTLTVNAPFVHSGFSEAMTPVLSASGTQAREFEIARAFMDYNDWSSTGVIMLDLMETSWDEGVTKEYAIRWGYSNQFDIDLVNIYGGGDNDNFEAFLGPLTLVSGDIYYLPIMVRNRYYSSCEGMFKTNRNLTTNALSTTQNTLYITPTAVPTNISDFTVTSHVEFAGAADIINIGNGAPVGIGLGDGEVPYSKLQVGHPESTTQTMLTIASRYNNTAPPALNFRSGHPSNANVWNMVQIRGDDDGNYNGRMEFLTTTVGGNSTGVPDIKMVLKANGNVGIATTAPTRKLQVEGSFYARGAEIGYNDLILKEVSSSPYSPELKFQNNTHILGIDYQNNETLRFITRSGATTVPITFQMRAGTITAVNFVLSSDERLKENIKELEPKKIEANWKSFNAKNNKESYRTGVIAQELEVKHPEFVETNDEGFKSVKYIDLLISKIAELEDRIKNLEK